ncbi:MAG: tRNA uridine(34) 5-carboxymethylaminomethyl modification radical SAM/GNAT enzyme Elp3 [Patescibacteria group bacterium]|nr:tRNA uridine(34) 5-carboxymethylaminomethyl modification radical SAM/GNAT enzyme Elp3 [Patescibacteria group bacterium]
MNKSINDIIYKIIEDRTYSWQKISKICRRFCKINQHDLYTNVELLQAYHNLLENNRIKPNPALEYALKLKETRSLSGIVVVSVLTKPFPCPGKCIYCPTQTGLPKSYVQKEPAVMRAIACNYDPYLQTTSRLKVLKLMGHKIDKINIRIIGGTWSYYPKNYQTWFIKELFRACNDFSVINRKHERGMSINKLQMINEESKNRIVEISIETRQDYINKDEILRLRKLGITKVELGIQSIYDDVLRINKRGHNIKTTVIAIKMLKDAGFKISFQVMPNLLGSSYSRDKKMFQELFTNPDFQPDYLKIYPLAVIKQSKLYMIYRQKKFKPYNLKQLTDLLLYIKQQVPYHCRIERVIRDIPSDIIIEGGAKVSNLRQLLQEKMTKESKICRCIRCREIKNNYDKKEKIYLFKEEYGASGGKEIFLSFENKSRTKLLSILRLRIPSSFFDRQKTLLPFLNNSALIREIHTYGPQIKISEKEKTASQHKGLGKRLLLEAEKIARQYNVKKISVISGIGVRGYFRSLGYKLQNTYMVKDFN